MPFIYPSFYICLPSNFFILAFLNKHLYPPSYPITAVLLTARLYIRIVIFSLASYKCRLKNKCRSYFEYELLSLFFIIDVNDSAI